MSVAAFGITEEEKVEIEEAMKARHIHKMPEFLRMAVFAWIRQNRPGGHRRAASTPEGDTGGAGGSAP